MTDQLRFTNVDPRSVDPEVDWGEPLLAARYGDRVAMLFRAEGGDLVAVADAADHSAMGLDGEVDGCGKDGTVWLVGGTLPTGAVRVQVRDGDAWTVAAVNDAAGVWFAPIRAEQEIVRFEAANGAVVPQAPPRRFRSHGPITDAWTPCPACDACDWEVVSWEERVHDDGQDDPEWDEVWEEHAARCTRCGHRVPGVGAPDVEGANVVDEARPPLTHQEFAGLVASHGIFELSAWDGRRHVVADESTPVGEPRGYVTLGFEAMDGRSVNVMTVLPGGADTFFAFALGDDEDTPEFDQRPGASAAANHLASQMDVSMSAPGEIVDGPAEDVALLVDGRAERFSLLRGAVGWVASGEVDSQRVIVTGPPGVPPESCSLRRVQDAGAYAAD